MRLQRRLFLVSAGALITLFALLIAVRWYPMVNPDPMRAAWQRALSTGTYRFDANVTIVTDPAPTPINAGRPPDRQDIYLQGTTDLPTETTELQLWTQGGNVMTGEGSVTMRIVAGRTLVRQGEGVWEEYDGLGELYAPGGDVLGYLSAARDAQTLGMQDVAGQRVTRYTFQIDGVALERYLRERQQTALRQANRLPPGVELRPAEEYSRLQGTGEVWINDDGLPVRQILQLTLRAKADQPASRAQLTMDFSNFGPLPSDTLPLFWQQWLWSLRTIGDSVLPFTVALLLGLGATIGLIRWRGSRRLSSLLATVLITALVGGPLLSAQRAHAIQIEVAEQTAQQRQAQMALERERASAIELPPEVAAARLIADVLLSEARGAATVDTDGDGLSDAQEALLGANPQFAGDGPARLEALSTQATTVLYSAPAMLVDDGRDTDGDGLTDFQEQFLGTNLLDSDTDSDGLSDFAEAVGFAYASQTWRLDPLAQDTNRDGVLDSLEVSVVGNALQARDTDGDGLPNAFDHDDDNDSVPDRLDLSPLTSSVDQGAFRGNRALWLKFDNLVPNRLVAVDIQVRPQDPTQLWYAQSRFDWPHDGAGQVQDRNYTTDDVQLLPLLEITIPANSFATLPAYTNNGNGNLSSPTLSAQGITLRQSDANTIVAYVPLSLVTDGQTGQRVAFSGRMLYQGAAAWGNAHRVRLVWAVQMKNDVDGFDQPGLVHVYDSEPWILTGLQVREDHSVHGVLLVADPQAESDAVVRDDALLGLINGLNQSFMLARSDLSPTALANRFHRLSNGGVSAEERWGLPNIFLASVYSRSDTLSLARDAATLNRNLLVHYIPAQYQPLLLHARSETFRALNMDSLGSNTSWSDTVLTMNLTASGQNAVLMQTANYLSLTGYEFSGGDWRLLTPEQMIQRFVDRHSAQASTDEETRIGQIVVLRNYLAVLVQGVMALVANGEQQPMRGLASPDASLSQINTALAAQGNGALKHALAALGSAQGTDTNSMLKMMGGIVKALGISSVRGAAAAWAVSSRFMTSFKAKASDAIRGAIVSALTVGLILAATAQLGQLSPELNRWLQTGGMELVAHVTSSVATIVKNGIDLVLIAKFGLQKITAASAALTIFVGGVLVVTAVGLAIYEAVSNQLSGVALAQLIIATVLQVAWIVFLTALAFIPKVGFIIVAVITIIDAVLSIFLSLILGRATTFSSWLFQQIARFVVDESRYLTVRPTIGNTNLGLINLAAGMSAGNSLRFSAEIYPNLAWNPNRIGNRWFGNPWNDWQARQRVSGAAALATHEQRLSVSPGWPPIQNSYPSYVDFSFPAGINRSTALWMNTAFNLPFKRCIILWCGAYDDVQYHNNRLVDSIVFDVFPVTLNEFVRMDWGGSVAFPPLPDADFDGIRRESDPNDGTWDSDGDGLSDAFEMQRASAGTRFNPSVADSDGDGLSDLVEARWGTDPARADTDGDGLSDAQEVNGQFITVGDRLLLVRTSPLATDSRGAGISDAVWLSQGGSVTARSQIGAWSLSSDFADTMRGLPFSCPVGACPTVGVTVAGRTGTRFDGNQFLVISDERFRMADELTFMAWIYPTANANGILINREGEYEVARFPDGSIQWAFANANPGWAWVNTGVIAPLHQWTHVAVTYNRGTVTTYLNGNPVHTYYGAGAIGDVDWSQNELRLGDRQHIPQRFVGVLAQAKLFSRALPQSEIGAQMTLAALAEVTLTSVAPTMAAAQAPIGVFPAVSDDNLVVRPGETLTYTVTLRYLLPDGRPLRGAVWVNTPRASLAAQSFELLPGQEQSFATLLTIPAEAPEGPFVLEAVTQYSLGGNPTARWSQPTFVEVAGADVDAVAVAVASGAAAPYGLVTANGGQVRFFAAQSNSLSAPVAVGVGTQPTLACLGGACLTVWQNGGTISAARIAGSVAATPINLGNGSAPAVASNGTHFIVVWIDNGVLRAQRVAANGMLSGPVLTIDTNLQSGSAAAVVATGESYLVAYERGAASQRDIWFARIDDVGVSIPSPLTTTPDDETLPALAYSVAFGRALVVYLRSGSVVGRLLVGSTLLDEAPLLSDGAIDLTRPTVAAAADHFVVAAGARIANRGQLLYQAVDRQQRLLGAPQRFAWLYDAPSGPFLALACATGQPCIVAPGGLSGGGIQIGALQAQLVDEASGLLDSGILPTPLRLVVDSTPPVASIVSLTDGSYVPAANASSGLVISGVVTDANPVEQVETSLNNGAWQEVDAPGTTWVTTIDIASLPEGAHTLRVRARDAAGNLGAPSAPVSFWLDRTPPTLTLSLDVPTAITRPVLDAHSGWIFPLAGLLSDAASGSAQLTLELLPASEDAVTSSAQEVTASDGAWQHNYRLTSGGGVDGRVTPPTGVYTVTLRAADVAGNVQTVVRPTLLRLDATPPILVLTSDPGASITAPLTLSGLVTDTGSVQSGVQMVEAAWLPLEQVDALAGADVRLQFEEPAGSAVFANALDASLIGSCSDTTCPQVVNSGRVGQALQLNDTHTLTIADQMGNLDQFSVAAWINGTQQIFVRGQVGQPGYFVLTTSGVQLQGNSGVCATTFALPGTGWRHVAATYDGAALTIYNNGDVAATTPCAAGTLPAAEARLSGFAGQIDEVYLYSYALAADEVHHLQAAADRNWQSVPLATPGAASSKWSLPVTGTLDGMYALVMRTADAAGNRTIDRDGQIVWRGMVDLSAPQVTVSVVQQGSGTLARTTITCQARDINLASTTLVCPAPGGTILEQRDTLVYYQPPAWRRLGDDLTLLHGRDITYVVQGHVSYSSTVTAQDTLGRSGNGTPLSMSPPVPAIDLLITAPAGNVFTTLAPITIAGDARADAGLSRVRVLVNETQIDEQVWTGSPSSGTFSVSWSPPGEGRYVLDIEVTDQANRVATRQLVLLVDTTPPTAIGFATPVVTTAHTLSNTLALPLQVTDSGVITSVQASFDGATWLDATADPVLSGRWWLPIVALASDPDNWSFTMHLRAVDAAGNVINATQALTVDVVPPAAQTVTLRVISGDTLSEGAIVRTPSVGLRMEWGAGSDNAGPVTFRVGWSVDREPNLASLTSYGTGAGSHDLPTPPEGRVLYAHLLQQDAHGNQHLQTFGPIIYDTRLTPDAISQTGTVAPERALATGWLNGECALIGQNSALARRTSDLAATNAVQRMYAGWDDNALRLAWRGSIWGASEDLFIYLDTAAGGASAVYTQGMAAGQPDLRLPTGFEPDYLLRLDDIQHVNLLRWDGANWVTVSGTWQAWSDPSQPDLFEAYLPFAALGISNPATTSVRMIAYATEEDSLYTWAVMPANNPLTSPRVLHSLSGEGISNQIELKSVIAWDNLGSGSCPGAGQVVADVRFRITTTPVGSIYSIFTDELIDAQTLLLDNNNPVASTQLDEIDNLHPPLFEGQVITYTIHYENVGEAPASNVRAWVINWGALRLPDGELKNTGGTPYYEQFVELGTIAPGTSGVATFIGIVDRDIARQAGEDEEWATVDVSFHDAATGLEEAIDWFFVDHPVDIEPPAYVAINEPFAYVKPGVVTVGGEAWDASDVPQIDLEVTVGTGGPTITSCTDPTPDDGEWQCTVNIGTPSDGTSVRLRARAADAGGQLSDWGEPVDLVVDAQAPRLVLSDASVARLGIGSVSIGTVQLDGSVRDERSALAIEICVDQNDGRGFQCEEVAVDENDNWSYALPIRAEVEQATQQLRLTPIDQAGNRGLSQLFTYVIDTVAPTLSGAFLASLQSTPTILTSRALIGGTYADAVGVTDITVRVERPDGLVENGAADLQGNQWQYVVPISVQGIYRIYVTARDAAGNTRVIGPLTLNGAFRIYMPSIFR
ncbi:MAG: hypothetical protein K6356_09830 [Chloroflexus sp.]